MIYKHKSHPSVTKLSVICVLLFLPGRIHCKSAKFGGYSLVKSPKLSPKRCITRYMLNDYAKVRNGSSVDHEQSGSAWALMLVNSAGQNNWSIDGWEIYPAAWGFVSASSLLLRAWIWDGGSRNGRWASADTGRVDLHLVKSMASISYWNRFPMWFPRCVDKTFYLSLTLIGSNIFPSSSTAVFSPSFSCTHFSPML